MAPILSSYSSKPVFIGVMVRDLTRFFPAVMAALEIRSRALIPRRPMIVNLSAMKSTLLLNEERSKFEALRSKFFKPLAEFSNLSFLSNKSKDFIVWLMFRSNWELLNRASTILLSIDCAITQPPPSIIHLPSNQKSASLQGLYSRFLQRIPRRLSHGHIVELWRCSHLGWYCYLAIE